MNAHLDEPATKRDLDRVKQDLTTTIDQVKQELTDKIDANGRKIDANSVKIDANGKKIDQVEQRLTAKIDANSAKIDRLTIYAIENRDQMATKDEVNKRFDVVNERFDELLRGQDEMIGILTRVDDERVATTAWVRRVEGDVETNTGEIKKIKTKLAMP